MFFRGINCNSNDFIIYYVDSNIVYFFNFLLK